MKYVIVTIEWLLSKGIVPQSSWRKSLDGKKVILHSATIIPVLDAGESIEIYWHDSPELASILNSSDWSDPESI